MVRQMTRGFAILGVWIGLASVAPGAEPPKANVADAGVEDATEGTGDSGSEARLETILAVWAAHGSRLNSGEFSWRIVRRNQSASFGALEDSGDQPFASDGSSVNIIRISFNERAVRLDAESIPTVGLSRRAAAAKSAATGAAGEHEQFQAALRGRFANDAAVPQDRMARVAYRVVADGEREVHFWGGARDSYPRVLVLAPGGAQDALGPDSLSDIPLYSGLVDALQVAVRPLGSNTDDGRHPALDQFRMLPDRPVVDGELCAVIEERRSKNWQGEVRRSWVDLSRGCVVVRCLNLVHGKLDGPQYDIDYKRDEQGDWLPRSIGVLRMSRLGDPLDELVVVRIENGIGEQTERRISTRAGSGSPISADAFAWEPRPGDWVDDFREGRQYFVRRDGSRRTISFSENYAGLTYQDLVAEDTGGKSLLGGNRRRIGSALVATVVKAGTWPGILVTLPAAFGVWFVFKHGIRFWPRRVNPDYSHFDRSPNRKRGRNDALPR